jgi:hypothetical protein
MTKIIQGDGMFVNRKDKKFDNITGGGSISKWQVALADARRKLSEYQVRSCQLRVAIEAIEGKIRAGEPWPEAATQN